MSYTTDILLTKIKNTANVPDNQIDYSDEDILRICTDELLNTICPFIIGFREEFLITSSDITITTATEYDIPQSAIGSTIRELKIVDSNNQYYEIPRLAIEEIDKYTDGFYLKSDKIVLLKPSNYIGYYLRIWYYKRPSVLIKLTDITYGTRQITNINTNTNTLTFSNLPSVWSNNTKVDLIMQNPPFRMLAENQSLTTSSNTIILSSLPTGLAVGDWVASTGYSPIPLIPAELHYLLIYATVLQILETQGDSVQYEKCMQKYLMLQDSASKLMKPRVLGKLININNENNLLDLF